MKHQLHSAPTSPRNSLPGNFQWMSKRNSKSKNNRKTLEKPTSDSPVKALSPTSNCNSDTSTGSNNSKEFITTKSSLKLTLEKFSKSTIQMKSKSSMSSRESINTFGTGDILLLKKLPKSEGLWKKIFF
jgi:hypothetical protein